VLFRKCNVMFRHSEMSEFVEFGKTDYTWFSLFSFVGVPRCLHLISFWCFCSLCLYLQITVAFRTVKPVQWFWEKSFGDRR
jgi:hypothetical protein